MKKIRVWKASLLLMMILIPAVAAAQISGPVVTADDLEKNLSNPKLVVLDVRKVEEYKAGHIPGSVNAGYGSWAIKKGELLNELPAVEDLADVISGAGIAADSIVVVVGKTDKVADQFDMTRVAWTLKFMGVPQVAVLSGGINKWTADKKAISTTPAKPKSANFKPVVNDKLFVNKAYVAGKLGKAVIVDTRGPAFFEGKEKLAFVPKLGRIKGAVNLPVGALYTPEGLYKDKATLAALAEKAAGADKDKEMILYCDTGKTCTSWALVMTDALGYKNVKIYDGSSMEWLADPAAPAEP